MDNLNNKYSSLTPLSQTVGEFLDEIRGGDAEYRRAYALAIRGLKDLYYDIDGKVRSVKLLVEPNKTARIPEGALKILKVGITVNGEFKSFVENHKIALNNENVEDCCGVCGLNNVLLDQLMWNECCFRNINQSPRPSNNIGGTTSYGLNRVFGTYYIKDDLILLGNETSYSTIIVEYLAIPEVNGEYYIHNMLSEAIVAWIKWKWFGSKKGTYQFDKIENKNEYYRLKRNGKYRLKSPTKTQMLQSSRNSTFYGFKK